MNAEEISFNEARQSFETVRGRIDRAVEAYEKGNSRKREELGISEADYIRLTRTIQLAEKYLPRRELIPAEQTPLTRRQEIFIKLVDAYRKTKDKWPFKKKPEPEKEEIFPTSYTMSEELVQNLKELRHYDYLLKHLTGENDKDLIKILDKKPTGEIVRELSEGPGILDDYRQGSWGIERICLDGMQNHLSTDAKGTTCWLHFEVDGKWVEAIEAKQAPEKITKIRFADDGVGFVPDNLLYLHSTKTSEDVSRGQFGEGMKLLSMASVNLGLNLEFQSRNWTALATGEVKQLVNTRDNDAIEERRKLVYKIKEYDGESLIGSRTIFHTPTPELIEYALQLPEKVLELNPHYRPCFISERGDIVSIKDGGQAFAKGIFVKNMNTLFSYNFDNADLNPDRNQFTNFNENDAVINIIKELNDIRIMKNIISKMLDYYKEPRSQFDNNVPIEISTGYNLYYQFERGGGVPSLWREAFRQVLEQKAVTNADGTRVEAVLKTDYEIPKQLDTHLAKYNVVTLPKYWTLAMQLAGVKTDRESLPEYIKDIIPTSLSLEYGQEIWNSERMLLDAIQNHLPSDCGGKTIFIRFQSSDGLWHDFSKFSDFDDADIKKIKISDDGDGYDVNSLGIFASVKSHNASSGKWGEGLKMLSAVSIRNNEKIVLRSRDWMATPATQKLILNQGKVNEKEVDQLVYETIKKINYGSDILNDGDSPLEKDNGYLKKNEVSSTTFVDPSPDLITEFRNVSEKVLLLAKKSAVARVDDLLVLDFNSGQLFVRGILIPGNHNIKYGYHFENFNIETRDRNAIKSESLKEQLRTILGKTDDERFISAFLRDAVEFAIRRDKECLEFTTSFQIPSDTYQADKWIKVFKQDFGNKTSIRRSSDQDMNAVHRAQHVGLDMVTLPDSVARALINLKGRDGQTIASYDEELKECINNIIDVAEEDLTDYERFMLEHLNKYSEILNKSGAGRTVEAIRVYTYDQKYKGPRAAGFAALGSPVSLSRQTLNSDLGTLGDVFFHEGGHVITGANDADSRFRDFFTSLLSKLAMDSIPIDKAKLASINKEALELHLIVNQPAIMSDEGAEEENYISRAM